MGILWTVIIVLVALWAIGLVLNLFGGLIHALLIAAAVLFVIRMFLDRRTAV